MEDRIRRVVRIEQTIRRVVTIVEERIGPKPVGPRGGRTIPLTVPAIGGTTRPALRLITRAA